MPQNRTECNISWAKRERARLAEAGELKDSFKSGAAGDRQTKLAWTLIHLTL